MVCTAASTEALGITVSDFKRHDPELLTSPSYMSGGDVLIRIAVQNRRLRVGIQWTFEQHPNLNMNVERTCIYDAHGAAQTLRACGWPIGF